MATLDENEEDQQQGQTQNGAPVSVPGGGGAAAAPSLGSASATSGTAASPTVSNTQQNGEGFVDVASYLDKNQAGSAQLGTAVSNNLTGKYNDLNNSLNNSYSDFNQRVQQGYTPENQSLISQASSSPTTFAQNPDNISAFQKQLNDSYTGPTSWNDITDSNGKVITPGIGSLQGKVAEGQQQASLINTPGGANVLASQVEQNPTAGISNLDALFLTGNPNSLKQVQTAAAPFTGLTGALNTMNTNAGNAVNAANNTAQKTSADALNAFVGNGGTVGNLSNEINTGVTQATNNANAQNNDLSTLLTNVSSAKATPQQLAELGLTQDQFNNLQQLTKILTNPNPGAGSQYKVNGNVIDPKAAPLAAAISQFYNPIQTGAINAATVATPEQYKELGAINQLIGANNTTGAPINSSNESLAGTAPSKGALDYQGAVKYLSNLLTGDYVTPPDPSAPSNNPPTPALGNINKAEWIVPAVAVTHEIVNDVVGGITNLFCFNGWMKVEMADGSAKEIKWIELGDVTRGGKVIALRQAIITDLYDYKGILVSGNHAVKEEKWIRVKDSKDARLLYPTLKNEESLVYNLVTTDHRIWIDGIEFADEIEQDNFEQLTIEESLEALNCHSTAII